MVVVFVGIGSNMGNRRINVRKALRLIGALKGTRILAVSRFIETLPQGGPRGQRKFLNGVVKIKTAIPPVTLLTEFKKIEKRIGRTPSVRWGPRVIDLDMLFYGGRRIRTKTLTVPHPRILERDFVITPLREVV